MSELYDPDNPHAPIDIDPADGAATPDDTPEPELASAYEQADEGGPDADDSAYYDADDANDADDADDADDAGPDHPAEAEALRDADADDSADDGPPREGKDAAEADQEQAPKKRRRRRRRKRGRGDAGPTSADEAPSDRDEESGTRRVGREPAKDSPEAGPLPAAFTELGLRDSVVRGVRDAGFSEPTEIQSQLIPAVLSGKDVLGQAKTGTGKTAAFGLPLLHMVDPDVPVQAMILTPTRELAAQVASELEDLGRYTPISAACIVGGESMRKQVDAIAGGAQIVVATPGRIADLQGRRQISYDLLRYVVLDEVDRMLDIGFREDIRKILKLIAHPTQTVFVSATISEDIEKLARQFMTEDAEKIVTTDGALTVAMVDQKYISVEPWDKRALLLHLLRHEKPDTALVFCRTKATVHRVAEYLSDKGLNAREIHADLRQRKRNTVIESLRQGNVDVVIASDLAARGLDVDHITHVINYDLPEDPEVYIHRIGRTARAGRQGVAWSFATPEDGRLLTAIEKLAGVMIEELDYSAFTPGTPPSDIAAARKRDAERRAVDPMAKIAGRAEPSKADDVDESELARMFPNGVVPKQAPKRGLGSRFRSRRSR